MMTPDQRLARHMRVEVMGGTVLQIPSFDEVMAAVIERERGCKVRLLQHAPEAIRWWVGALQVAQDWLDAQPLADVLPLAVQGWLIEERGTRCDADSRRGLYTTRDHSAWATTHVRIKGVHPYPAAWGAPLSIQMQLTNRVDR